MPHGADDSSMSDVSPQTPGSIDGKNRYGTRLEVKSYAQEKKILALVDDFVDLLLREKPDEPLDYLAEVLSAKREAQSRARGASTTPTKRDPDAAALPVALRDAWHAACTVVGTTPEAVDATAGAGADKAITHYNALLAAALPTEKLKAAWKGVNTAATAQRVSRTSKPLPPQSAMSQGSVVKKISQAPAGEEYAVPLDDAGAAKFDGSADARTAAASAVEVYSRTYTPDVDIFECLAGLKQWHCAGRKIWPNASIERLGRNSTFAKLHHNYGEPDEVVLPIYLYTCSLHDAQSWSFWVRSAHGNSVKSWKVHGWIRPPQSLAIGLERAWRNKEMEEVMAADLLASDAAFEHRISAVISEQRDMYMRARDVLMQDPEGVAEDPEDTLPAQATLTQLPTLDYKTYDLVRVDVPGTRVGEAWEGLTVFDGSYGDYEIVFARYELTEAFLTRQAGNAPMTDSVMWLPPPRPHIIEGAALPRQPTLPTSESELGIPSPPTELSVGATSTGSGKHRERGSVRGGITPRNGVPSWRAVSSLRLADLPPPSIWEYVASRRTIEELVLPTSEVEGATLSCPALAGFDDVRELVERCFSQRNQQDYNRDLHEAVKALLNTNGEYGSGEGFTPIPQTHTAVSTEYQATPAGNITRVFQPNPELQPFTELIQAKLGSGWETGEPSPLEIAHSFDVQTVMWKGRTWYAALSGSSKLVMEAVVGEEAPQPPCQLWHVGSMFEDQPYSILNATVRNLQSGNVGATLAHRTKDGRTKDEFKVRPPQEIGKALGIVNDLIREGGRVSQFSVLLEHTMYTTLESATREKLCTARYTCRGGDVSNGADTYVDPMACREVGWWKLTSPTSPTCWWLPPPAPQPTYIPATNCRFDIGAWMLSQVQPTLYYIDKAMQNMTHHIASKNWQVARRNLKSYRGLRDAPLNPHVYATGNVVVWGALSSASRDMSISQAYACGEDSSVFIITGSSARCVAPWSRYGREEEWLYPMNSMFRITHMLSDDVKQMMGKEQAQIYSLEEVDVDAKHKHAIKRHLWRAKTRQSAGVIFACITAVDGNGVLDMALKDESEGMLGEEWKIAVNVNFDPMQTCPVESSNTLRLPNVTNTSIQHHVDTILRAFNVDGTMLKAGRDIVTREFDAQRSKAVQGAVSALLGTNVGKGPDFMVATAHLDAEDKENQALAGVSRRGSACHPPSPGVEPMVQTPKTGARGTLMGGAMGTPRGCAGEAFLARTSFIVINAKKPSGRWEVTLELQKEPARAGHAVGDAGAAILKHVLVENVPLQRIDLQMNRMTVQGAEDLLLGLRRNKHVVQLTFTDKTKDRGMALADEPVLFTPGLPPLAPLVGSMRDMSALRRVGSTRVSLEHLQRIADLRCLHNQKALSVVSLSDIGPSWPHDAAEALWDVDTLQMEFSELFDHDVERTEQFLMCLFEECQRQQPLAGGGGEREVKYPRLPGVIVAAARCASLGMLEQLLKLPDAKKAEMDPHGESAYLKFVRRYFHRKDEIQRERVRQALHVRPSCRPPPIPKRPPWADFSKHSDAFFSRIKDFVLSIMRCLEEKISATTPQRHSVQDLPSELCENLNITLQELQDAARGMHAARAKFDAHHGIPVGRLHTTLLLYGCISGEICEYLPDRSYAPAAGPPRADSPDASGSLASALTFAALNVTQPGIYGGSRALGESGEVIQRWAHTWTALNAVISQEVPIERVLFRIDRNVSDASVQLHTSLRRGQIYAMPYHSLWREERRKCIDSHTTHGVLPPMTRGQFAALFNDHDRQWGDAVPWDEDELLVVTPEGAAIAPLPEQTTSWSITYTARGLFKASEYGLPGGEHDVVLPAMETFVIEEIDVCRKTLCVTIRLLARACLCESDPELAVWTADTAAGLVRTSERLLNARVPPSDVTPTKLIPPARTQAPPTAMEAGGHVQLGTKALIYHGHRVARRGLPEGKLQDIDRQHLDYLEHVNSFNEYKITADAKGTSRWWSHATLHPDHALPRSYRLGAVLLEKLDRGAVSCALEGTPWVELPTDETGQLEVMKRDQGDVIEFSAATLRELHPKLIEKHPDPWFDFLGVPPPDPAEVYGDGTFSIRMGQIQQLLKSFHVQLSDHLPRRFYEKLVDLVGARGRQPFWQALRTVPLHHITGQWARVHQTTLEAVQNDLDAQDAPADMQALFAAVDKSQPDWPARYEGLYQRYRAAQALREQLRLLQQKPEDLFEKFVRPLQDLLEDAADHSMKYGFRTACVAACIQGLSLTDISTQVCISQRCYFFTSSTNGADNRITRASYRTIACLNIPGIDFSSMSREALRYFVGSDDAGTDAKWTAFLPDKKECLRGRVKDLYTCIFRAAQRQGVHHISAMPLGLGKFTKSLSVSLQNELVELYFAVQFELLCESDWGFHTYWVSLSDKQRPHVTEPLEAGLRQGGGFNRPDDEVYLRCNILLHNKCAKALAAHLADNDLATGLLVATDSTANVLGALGSTWEQGRMDAYSGDQDWASTSTGVLGCFPIQKKLLSDGYSWTKSV